MVQKLLLHPGFDQDVMQAAISTFPKTMYVQAADTQLGLMYNFGTDGSDGIPYPESQWDSEVV